MAELAESVIVRKPVSKSILLLCGYGVHSNVFNFMEIRDIVLLRRSLHQSLCSHEFEYVDRCTKEIMKGFFQRFKTIELLMYYKQHESESESKKYDILSLIVDEILGERLKIFLRPYSEQVDIYDLVVNGVLLNNVASNMFEMGGAYDVRQIDISKICRTCDMGQIGDFDFYMVVQEKHFDKIERLLIEIDCGMIKYVEQFQLNSYVILI